MFRVLPIVVVALFAVVAAEYSDVLLLHNSADFNVEEEQSKCQSNDQDLSRAYCTNVEYLYGVSDIKETLSVKSNKKLPKLDAIDQSEEPFATLFESYILTNRPFKGIVKDTAAVSVSDCAAAESMQPHPLFHDYPLRDCVNQDVIKDVKMPEILANSFNLRVPAATTDSPFVDVHSHWPALLLLQTNTPTNVARCPLGMHMVLWGVQTPVTLRVFHEYTSSFFQPNANDVLHYFNFAQHGFVESKLPPYTSTTLGLGEYIFVPYNYLVSMQVPGKDSESVASVMQYCYFDASNMNTFRSYLQLEALVSDFSKNNLKLLSSPSFDVSMEREVSAMPYSEFSVYPRKTDKGDDKSGGRDRGKKATFRDWQETSKWTHRITSLTIPQPPAPTVLGTGRNNATLQWYSPYIPDANDKTKFGFNVTVCETDKVNHLTDESNVCRVVAFDREALSETEDKFKSMKQESRVITFSTVVFDLTPSTAYFFRIVLVYGAAGSASSDRSASVTTKPLDVPSVIASAIIADAALDPTQVILNFTKPFDDGGRAILGYHVYARHVEKHLPSDWLWNGHYDGEENPPESAHMSIIVHNLLPNSIYEFRVAAFNELGNASISQLSKKIVTKASSSILASLFGTGHKNRHQASVGSLQDYDHSKMITMSDAQQKIFIFQGTQEKEEFDVWDAHYSPKLFTVTGDAVWANPPLADTQLNNAAELQGRIAIVQRGSVAIAIKAKHVQRAGGIAMIVLDNGKCEKFDQHCMPGSDKSKEERFGAVDNASAWKNLRIPVALMMESDGKRLLTSLGLPQFEEIVEKSVHEEL